MMLEIGYNEKIEGQKFYRATENGKFTKSYNTWINMLQRCYNPKYQEKDLSCIGWTVCNEWHNFQNFAKWFEDNYYEVEGEKVVLDKDLFGSNSKVLNADTCCFIPKVIDKTLIEGKGYTFNKPIGKYQAYITHKGKMINLGYFDTEEEARYTYKLNKQFTVYMLAQEYKDVLPTRVYQALMEYRIDVELDELDEVDTVDELDTTELDEQLIKLVIAISDRTNHMTTTELLNEMANYSSALDSDDTNENKEIHKLYISFLNSKLQDKIN